jgi:hypothetical protein
LALLPLISSCRQPVQLAPVPVPPPEKWEYCWWTVMESSIPLGFISGTFQRAFSSAGLSNIRSTRVGDTVLVIGGPLSRDSAPAGTQYWSRAVAYQKRDSTHFRFYTAVVPPSGGWPAGWNDAGARIGFCGDVGKAASIPYFTKKDPGAEEQMSVWHRVP